MAAKDDILAPFDFSASPSMSSQLFGAAPGIFGDGDGVSPLQGINRVMVGGPLDLIDLIGRGGDVAMRAAAEGAEALTGSKRLGRDIYGFGQAVAPLLGSSPSALQGARYPSTRRAAPSDRAPSGITLAIEGPQKPAGLLPAPPKPKILEGGGQKSKNNISASEFFESMGDEGAGLEFPEIGKALDSYVYDLDREGILAALKSNDYPEYRKILKTNLDSLSDGNTLSVSRIENYLDPMAGVEGRRTKSFFDVDKDDVLFVGSDAERELIIRGPDGGPMSVRLEANDLPSSAPVPVVPKKAIEGEIVSGPSDEFLKAKARRDSAMSDAMRDSVDEELDYLGLEDSFQTIRNDIEDGFVGATDRGFEPMDADGFFDTLQDRIMYERMKTQERGEKVNMGEIIAQELPETIEDFERSFGLFVDPSVMTSKISKTADDVYGFGVGAAKKRRDEAAQAVSDMRAERNRLAMDNRKKEFYRSIGITPDMTDAQIRDILYQRQTGMMQDLAGAGISKPEPEGPNLRVVIDNDEIQKKKIEADKFRDEFEYDVFHGQRDPESSIGVVKDPSGREVLVEDATGEFGGINAFESSADKFPSQYPTDLGTFVTESTDVANYFAGDAGAVYPLKMRMKNPMRYETYEDLEDALSEAGETSDLTKRLIDEGYDGIEITYSDTDIPEIRRDFIPFDGRQLRSVNARFDPDKRDSRNITYKNGGMVYNPFKMGIGAF